MSFDFMISTNLLRVPSNYDKDTLQTSLMVQEANGSISLLVSKVSSYFPVSFRWLGLILRCGYPVIHEISYSMAAPDELPTRCPVAT